MVSRNVPPRAAVTTIIPAVGGPSRTTFHSSGEKAALVVMPRSYAHLHGWDPYSISPAAWGRTRRAAGDDAPVRLASRRFSSHLPVEKPDVLPVCRDARRKPVRPADSLKSR